MTRIAGIVLAAGASTRLGVPKQLLEIDGVPLVRRAALACLEAGASRVTIVLGANRDIIEPVVADLDRIDIVVNSRWNDGLATSIAAGVSALEPDAGIHAVLLTVSDQPAVTAASLRLLIDAFAAGHRIVAAEYDGIIGVPAIIPREHFAALTKLEGDRGAGAWLRQHSDSVTAIPLSSAGLDIDTPQDAERLNRTWNSS